MKKLTVTPEMRKKWKRINAKRIEEGKPPLNFPLFVKVRNRIALIPESYDQSTYYGKSSRSPCGTVACLAGEAVICAAPSVRDGVNELFHAFNRSRHRPSEMAEKLLGLDSRFLDADESDIFDATADCWPRRFNNMFEDGKEAQAAVGFLTHIIRTGKVLE